MHDRCVGTDSRGVGIHDQCVLNGGQCMENVGQYMGNDGQCIGTDDQCMVNAWEVWLQRPMEPVAESVEACHTMLICIRPLY